jgi:hypothetical protein
MPKGPKGQKRPADVSGIAVTVMRIATGQIEEPKKPPRGHAGGKRGGAARAAKLSPEQRTYIAKKAAKARWAK